MAESSGSHRPPIEPWSGTGWPLEFFKDRESLKTKNVYFCTQTECNRNKDRILREPYQLVCGHRLCKACLERLRNVPENQQICDACKEEHFDELQRTHQESMDMDVQPYTVPIELIKVIPDRAASREINKLEVICPYGCDLSGMDRKLTIRNLEKHMGECRNRMTNCDRCNEEIVFSQQAEHMKNDCPFRLVDCPNGCGKRNLQGKDLSRHLAECVKKPPVCRLCMQPYTKSHHIHLNQHCKANCPFGCTDVKPDSLIIHHLNDPSNQEKHIRGLLEITLDIKEAVDKNTAASMAAGTGQAAANSITQAQMSAILDRLLQLECRSEKTQRQLMDKVNQLTHQTASALLENAGKAETNSRELGELDNLFKVLANDVHMLTSYDTTFRSLTEKVAKQENETAERLNKLESLSNIRLAEIEDQKTALSDFQMTSFNGRLLWRIDRVSHKRTEAHIRHSIFSHPFYTEVYGYKMCARLYFNGDGNGKGTHISLFFVVMKGDYDALLPWPFQQKVTMKLKNQAKKRSDIVEKFRPEPSSSSFAKPKNEMNIASGCPQFALQDTVFDQTNGFVVDDTMFVEIIVDNSYEALHGLNVSVQETRSASNLSAYPK